MAGTIAYDRQRPIISAAIGGDRWVRGWVVTGLENGPDHSDLAVEIYALIPNKGTSVPGALTGMILDDATITRIWRERAAGGGLKNTWGAVGTITYRSPTQTTVGIEVPDANGPGVTLSSEVTIEEYETDVDFNGDQIETRYDGEVQAHRLTAFRNVETLVFARPEDQNPRGRADTYVNKLNSGTWNGYGDETVLCQAIRYDTNDNATWTVRYVFAVKPFGWKQRAIHEDPYYPGQPIPLSTLTPQQQGEAVANPTLQESISFAGLNITL